MPSKCQQWAFFGQVVGEPRDFQTSQRALSIRELGRTPFRAVSLPSARRDRKLLLQTGKLHIKIEIVQALIDRPLDIREVPQACY